MIGVDGWIKILQRTEGYDGFEQVEEFAADGEVNCIETRIFTTRFSHPTKYRAYMKEYRRISGDVAVKIPIHMLGIYSLRHAARLFTPIGASVVTEEEARWMDAYDATPVETRHKQNRSKSDELADRFAGKEFDALPVPQGEQPLNEEDKSIPFNPPTKEEIDDASKQAENEDAEPQQEEPQRPTQAASDSEKQSAGKAGSTASKGLFPTSDDDFDAQFWMTNFIQTVPKTRKSGHADMIQSLNTVRPRLGEFRFLKCKQAMLDAKWEGVS
jgi:hypothetical protein